jgi:uncharacterized protein (DUF1330 family)
MSVTLCVLLWAHEGHEGALARYEDRVLELLGQHGASLLQRARTDGSGGAPLEVQILEFPSEATLSDYMADERRAALAADRDGAVARTDMLRVALL